jgi:hypothetical protein
VQGFADSELDSEISSLFSYGREVPNLHLMSPLGYAAMLKQVSLLLTCVSGHIQILIFISKRFLFRQQKDNQPSPHVTPQVCRHAQTGQSSAHLRVRAYPDLDSHFKEVSVPSTEREPNLTSRHLSRMPPCSNRSVFCSPVSRGIYGS